MGNQLTAARRGSASATDFLEPRPKRFLRRYTLQFETVVHRYDMADPERRQVVAAKRQLRDPETWREYLVAATEGAGATRPIPLYNLQCRILHQDTGFFRGLVSWIGPAVPAEPLRKAVEWCIGERMAQYGLIDERYGWFGITTPQRLRISYPRLEDFPLERGAAAPAPAARA